jgi:CheY-like chemotaxis protein
MKADVRLRSIPVIVITGLRRMNDYARPFIECFFQAEQLKVSSPEKYLDKPIDKASLLTAIEEQLGPVGCGA